jgi:hypothetical protein
MLGYDVKKFNVKESKDLAQQLGKAFRSYGKKVGLPGFALDAIYAGE